MYVAFYKTHKMRKLRNTLPQYYDLIRDLIIIPAGLRRKANFEAIKKNDNTFMGFHRHNSRQIINLEICKIIRPEISVLIDPLKKLLNDILENLEKAEFFIVLAENGLDVGLEIQKVKQFPSQHKVTVQEFAKTHNLTRFIFKHGNKFETIYQNSIQKSPFIKFAEFEVEINPWSFMQTSKEAEKSMLEIIQNILNQINNKQRAIDLFSGRGTYSLSLINNFDTLEAVELSGDSIFELEKVSKKHNLPIKTTIRDLFMNPVTELELNDFDLAIINPPRAGAEKQSYELNNSVVKNIIYVSCNPETFARDLEILKENYKLNFIQPIDQFIWSNHLEIIVWLERI
jgi:23S rRNA (uracil1939-C5)-methyltransferase